MKLPGLTGRWPARALPLPAVLLIGLLAAPAMAGEDPRYASVRHTLGRAAHDRRSERDVVEDLVELGPDLIPVYFELAIGTGLQRVLGADEPFVADAWIAAPDAFPAYAYRALALEPAADVLAFLTKVLDRRDGLDPVEKKQVVLRVLRDLGSADGIALLWRVAQDFGDLAARYPSVRREISGALIAIVRRDAHACREIETELDELPDFLQEILVEALGAAERPRAAGVLETLLERAPDAARRRAVLAELVHLERLFPWQLAGSSELELGRLFTSIDPEDRRAAPTLAAELLDAGRMPALIALCDDDDARVRRAAQAALVTLAGVPAGEDGETWIAWFEREETWWFARSEGVNEALEGAKPGAAVDALRELARHPLFRRDTAERIARSLGEQPPACAVGACRVLQTLGSRSALPGLVLALELEDDRVRAAALGALQALTGERLPLDPDAWHDVLGD